MTQGMKRNESGHDFSRAKDESMNYWALALEEPLEGMREINKETPAHFEWQEKLN
jgi:hypothetical protein